MRIASKYKVLNPTTLPLTRTTYLAMLQQDMSILTLF